MAVNLAYFYTNCKVFVHNGSRIVYLQLPVLNISSFLFLILLWINSLRADFISTILQLPACGHG